MTNEIVNKKNLGIITMLMGFFVSLTIFMNNPSAFDMGTETTIIVLGIAVVLLGLSQVIRK